MKYQDYIDSERWRSRRNRFLAEHGRACRMCGATKKIHVHHLTYERIGHELDDDLMVLCPNHHRDVHKYIRKHRLSIREGTMAMLDSYSPPAPKPTPTFRASHKKPETPAVHRNKYLEVTNGRQKLQTIPLARHRTKRQERRSFANEVAALDEWNKKRRAFIPERQRITQQERANQPHSGPEGRLGGLPITTAAASGRTRPSEDT